MSKSVRELNVELRGFYSSLSSESAIMNIWGATDGQCAALNCIVCHSQIHDPDEFVMRGPKLGTNRWFCPEHADRFRSIVDELERRSVSFDDIEFQMLPGRIFEKEACRFGSCIDYPDWVYIGLATPRSIFWRNRKNAAS